MHTIKIDGSSCLLFIVSGGTNRKTSPPEAKAFTSLGSMAWRSPFCSLDEDNLMPSWKSESIDVNNLNPRSVSMAFPKEGTTACMTAYTVLAENVNCFISEKASSLGTYTSLLLLFSEYLSKSKTDQSTVISFINLFIPLEIWSILTN